MTSALTAAAVVVCAFLSGASALAQQRYTVRPIREFRTPDKPEMLMPTSVAVGAGGHVFVSDGANDRILEFDQSGVLLAEIRDVSNEALSRPTGIRLDPAGRLWIADTGNSRVVVRGRDGGLERVIALPQGDGDQPPDVTDVATSPDGAVLWIVDNDNHRLARYSIGDGTWRYVGTRGEALGQFHYPFMMAVSAQGDVFVTEAVGGRVQMISAAGRFAGTVASFGVDVGQLYRPKGIAVDRAGNVWVADGTTKVIQVFTPAGRLMGIVRDPQGEVMKFATPSGMTFDAAGNLYVVELSPSRVRKFEVTISSTAEGLPDRQAPGSRSAQPRGCTACHLEWVAPLADGVATALSDVPSSPAWQPYASRSENCVSCHDGSVVDSRTKVWRDHSHRTGIIPPSSMSIPRDLPLVNGEIACRTCHSAHTRAGSGNLFREAVFLRVETEPNELCIKCHTSNPGGSSLHSHPLGSMEVPFPTTLLSQGARTGPVADTISCMSCHQPHGSAETDLLVMGTSSNQLCIACHEETHPQQFKGATQVSHPVSGLLDARQLSAVAIMGTRASPEGELLCLSCHSMHQAPVPEALLAESLSGSTLCMQCHADYGSVRGTNHDLRVSAPAEQNLLGATAQAAGPCSACHSAHTTPRNYQPSVADPSGSCTTCHQAGQCAGSNSGQPFSHPVEVGAEMLVGLSLATNRFGPPDSNGSSLDCSACHDPHQRDHPFFLRAPSETLCASCHGVQSAGLFGGGHDFTDRPELTNAKGRWAAQSGSCSVCHAVHDAQGPALWAVTNEPPQNADDLCISCHNTGNAMVATALRPLVHPTGDMAAAPVEIQSGDLPLFDEQGHRAVAGLISCATCHDPHADAALSKYLLRTHASDGPPSLCASCHPQSGSIAISMHNSAALDIFPSSNQACGPCHSAHVPVGMTASSTWVGPTGASGDPVSVQKCTGCHVEGGGAKAVAWNPHPPVHLVNSQPEGSPGFMPLVDGNGAMAPKGQIACVTCHLPHGREPGHGVLLAAVEPLPLDLLRATKPMVRSYVAPNLCTGCHGFDGIRRFLYYHRSSAAAANKPPP